VPLTADRAADQIRIPMSIWRVNVACLVSLAPSAIAQDSQSQNEPWLDKTIDYLASVLETGGGDQKILFGGDYGKETCRLFISDTVNYALVKPAKGLRH
jgi:hypothetical protein